MEFYKIKKIFLTCCNNKGSPLCDQRDSMMYPCHDCLKLNYEEKDVEVFLVTINFRLELDIHITFRVEEDQVGEPTY